MPTVLLEDLLTDSAGVLLEAHTPVGSVPFSWVKIAGASLAFSSPGWHKNASTQPLYVADADPGTADYDAIIPVHIKGSAAQAAVGGVGVRMNGTNQAGYYFAVVTANGGTPVFRLFGLDAGGSNIFTPVEVPVPAGLYGTDALLTLRCEGTTLTGFVNGVQRVQKTDATYASGKIGLIGGWQILSSFYSGSPDPIGMAQSGTSAQGISYSFDFWQAAESLPFQIAHPTSSFPGTFQYIPGSPAGSQPQTCTLDRDVGQVVAKVQGPDTGGKVEVFDANNNLLGTGTYLGTGGPNSEETVTLTFSGIRKIKFTPATSGPSDDVTWKCSVTNFSLANGVDADLIFGPFSAFSRFVVTPVAVPLANSTFFIDRRIPFSAVSAALSGGETEWTLPYAIDEGATVLAVTPDGLVIPVVVSASNKVKTTGGAGDLRSVQLTFGIQYEFRYEMSPIFYKSQKRDGSEQAETRGRLQVRAVDLDYAATRNLTAQNTVQDGTLFSKVLANPTARDGKLHVPVLTRGDVAQVVFTDSGPLAVRLTGLDWEGYYHSRSRRV